MNTLTHELADGIFHFSTCVPDAAPAGFTFDQFLIRRLATLEPRTLATMHRSSTSVGPSENLRRLAGACEAMLGGA